MTFIDEQLTSDDTKRGPMEEGHLRDPDKLDINQNVVSLGLTYCNIDHLKYMQQQKLLL